MDLSSALITILVTLLCLIFGGFVIIHTFRELWTGTTVGSRSGTWKRSREPIMFWFVTASRLLIGVIALAGGALGVAIVLGLLGS